MNSSVGPDGTIRHRLHRELTLYAVTSAYLFVCIGVVLLYKTAILRGEGIGYAPYGVAAVKALILAKFLLLGHAARIGDRYRRRRLIHVILSKSLMFLLLLVTLSVAEEVIAGALHGRTLGASLAEFGGNMLWESLAASLIMLLILIPYIATKELSAVLGEGRLRQLLLEYRTASTVPPRAGHPAQ